MQIIDKFTTKNCKLSRNLLKKKNCKLSRNVLKKKQKIANYQEIYYKKSKLSRNLLQKNSKFT